MLKFNDIPIGKKINLIVGLGMGAAMLAVLLVFLAFDRHTLKQSLLDELTGHARVMALRSSVALIFNDHRNAQQNLASLSVRPNIMAACIYKHTEGAEILFASYYRSQAEEVTRYNDALCQPTGSLHQNDNPHDHQRNNQRNNQRISVVEKITHNANISQHIGHIIIISDTSAIQQRTIAWLYFGALMFVVASSFAMLMTSRMKKSVVSPLEKLMFTMRDVMDKKDLSVRAEPSGKDEVGKLVEQFNAMLDIIYRSQHTLEFMYRDLVVNSANAEKSVAELEAKNQQIKDMLGGAAHDLRQPLQAMSLFVATIEHQNSDTDLDPLLGQLKQAMQNLAALFSEILDVSRAEATGKIDAFKPLALDTLFSQLEIEFSVLAKSKGLNFRVRSQGNTVNSIAGLLERIIRNLISNAINYTEHGWVFICERRRGDALFIEVWDSGCGIAEDKLHSIFQRFEQAQDVNQGLNSERRQRGYGLGLALVKQFSEMLGYTVDVQSKLHVGSRFRIRIPERFICETTTQANRQINTENKLSLAGGEYHIVVVDDDATIRDGLQKLLNIWGMQCTALGSLEAVQEYFSAPDYRDPDLIISDYQLQNGVTGDQVIQHIYRTLGFTLPALIITGSHDANIHSAIRASGFDFLLKPLATPKLQEKLAALLE